MSVTSVISMHPSGCYYIICRCITSPARAPPKRFYDPVNTLYFCNITTGTGNSSPLPQVYIAVFVHTFSNGDVDVTEDLKTMDTEGLQAKEMDWNVFKRQHTVGHVLQEAAYYTHFLYFFFILGLKCSCLAWLIIDIQTFKGCISSTKLVPRQHWPCQLFEKKI